MLLYSLIKCFINIYLIKKIEFVSDPEVLREPIDRTVWWWGIRKPSKSAFSFFILNDWLDIFVL